jgi:hypothetical protein
VIKLIQNTSFILCLLAPTLAIAAESHPQVQAALDWQLPDNICGDEPVLIGAELDVVDPSQDITYRYDVDYYKLERHERSMKRWNACITEYKEDLMNDFEALKNCAQHGLTQAQADTILGKLALIQEVYLSPDAVAGGTGAEADPSG